MATIANLNILLSLEDQATKGLEKTQRSLMSWGQSLQRVGAGLTAGITVPVIAGAAAVVKMASDQQEAINAVTEVYGEASKQVIAYGENAAQAMGLATSEYLSGATVLGVYATAAGLAGDDAVKFANDNLQLAADLGSFFNDSTENVSAALSAAYRGEFDSLDKYGIMLNQTTLEQFALAEGIWDGNDAMSNQEKILATNAYLQANAGAAAGDFARTSNSLANSQKILRAQLKNVGAQLGQVLLPTVTKVVAVIRELLTRFQGLSPEWQKWIVLAALAAAAIGPFLIVLGTLLTVLPAIGAALAVLTGPIGLVIAAIALLTAAYIGNWWGFRDAVDGVAGAVKDAALALWDIDAVRSVVTSAIDSFVDAFTRIYNAVEKVGTALLAGDWRTALAGLGDLFAVPFKHIGDFIKGIETGFEPLDALLTNVGNMFTDLGRIIQELFQGDFSGAIDVFERAIGRIPEIVRGAFDLIPWASIGATIVSAIQGLPALLSDVTSTLKQVGIDLLVGVLAGLNEYMPTVTAWLGLVGSIAWAAVGKLSSTLLDKGIDLLQGVLDGLNEMLPTVTAWLGLVGSVAVEAVGSLAETLLDKGRELLQGIVDGLNNNVTRVKGWMTALPGVITGALGSLSNTLWNAGWSLIEGLVQGIISRVPYLVETLGWISKLIPFEKGPPSKDAVLLFDNGVLIMSGLIHGIESQVPMLDRTLAGITDGIGFGGSMGVSLRTGAPFAAAMNVTGAFDGDDDGGRGVTIHAGIYNEADRYWAPEQTLRARGMQARRR